MQFKTIKKTLAAIKDRFSGLSCLGQKQVAKDESEKREEPTISAPLPYSAVPRVLPAYRTLHPLRNGTGTIEPVAVAAGPFHPGGNVRRTTHAGLAPHNVAEPSQGQLTDANATAYHTLGRQCRINQATMTRALPHMPRSHCGVLEGLENRVNHTRHMIRHHQHHLTVAKQKVALYRFHVERQHMSPEQLCYLLQVHGLPPLPGGLDARTGLSTWMAVVRNYEERLHRTMQLFEEQQDRVCRFGSGLKEVDVASS